eukprot:CAMPEP_0168390984 /NCGR_PEP_ID=MMETSP0228-20121227/17753_1 /TAXON_ID=133427 /ORGANISM="Protoceratium reticulatum, Strain CCCM 535 (=CCMP 1889)" /LENGTH=102 /DNA_ID=CAMNT_0008404289 /DNA_START=62 /DNA_END=366 /DNA_ORIENTATION=+
MANLAARRSSPLLSAGALAASAWLLVLLVRGPVDRRFAAAFVATPASHSRARGRTTLRGFKDEFEAWRGSLTDEEQSLVQAQAEGEFNKKFRKSDDFKKELP